MPMHEMLRRANNHIVRCLLYTYEPSSDARCRQYCFFELREPADSGMRPGFVLTATNFQKLIFWYRSGRPLLSSATVSILSSRTSLGLSIRGKNCSKSILQPLGQNTPWRD